MCPHYLYSKRQRGSGCDHTPSDYPTTARGSLRYSCNYYTYLFMYLLLFTYTAEVTTANIERPKLNFSCTNEFTVQSPHRVDQEETSKDTLSVQFIYTCSCSYILSLSYISTASVDGVAGVTTHPQTTPSLQGSLLGTAEMFSLFLYDYSCCIQEYVSQRLQLLKNRN